MVCKIGKIRIQISVGLFLQDLFPIYLKPISLRLCQTVRLSLAHQCQVSNYSLKLIPTQRFLRKGKGCVELTLQVVVKIVEWCECKIQTLGYCMLLAVPQTIICLNYEQGILEDKNYFHNLHFCNYFVLCQHWPLRFRLPSLGDVGYDGWLCTFPIQQQLEIPSARSRASPIRATGTVRKRQAVRLVRPSRTKSNLPGHSPPAS
jgi:hypothetical protein